MKKLLRLLLLVPLIGFTQVQIGQDIVGESANDACGHGVAVSNDGSIIAIGSPNRMSSRGVVRIYEKVNNTWIQIGNDIVGEGLANYSGRSISLSYDGTIVAIGAHGNSDNGGSAGHVRVYKNINNTWTQIGQDIDGEGTMHQSGTRTSLSADGTILAISDITLISSGANGNGRIFKYDAINDVWNQMGSSFVGLGLGRNTINIVISGDGSKAIVGNTHDTGYIYPETNGDVRVYEYDIPTDTWIQVGQTIDLGNPLNDNVGVSVSASYDGSMLSTTRARHPGLWWSAKVYKYINGVWTEYGQEIDDIYNSFLSADGSVLVTSKSGPSADSRGKARVFKDVNGTWTQVGQTIVGDANYDRLGLGYRGVAISGDGFTFITGVPGAFYYGNPGYTRVYDLTSILSTETFELQNINIYPNPTQNTINIDLPNSIQVQSITLYDLVGKKLLTTKNKNIDISSYNSGMYILEIETNKGKSTRKIVKN